jgi:hypothetical protein
MTGGLPSWQQAPRDSRPVFFFCLTNTCRYSPYVISSLTRGCVCHLQLLLVLARAIILRSEYSGTHDHILLSQIREPPNLDGQVPVFLRTILSLSLSLSHIATDGQSVCLSWYRAPSGAHDQIFVTVWQFLFCLWGGRPLWREGGSVFCSRTILTLSLAYNISARTTYRTQLFHCCSPNVALLRIWCLATRTCLPSRCLETALVYSPTSRSLHSNGCIRYNI